MRQYIHPTHRKTSFTGRLAAPCGSLASENKYLDEVLRVCVYVHVTGQNSRLCAKIDDHDREQIHTQTVVQLMMENYYWSRDRTDLSIRRHWFCCHYDVIDFVVIMKSLSFLSLWRHGFCCCHDVMDFLSLWRHCFCCRHDVIDFLSLWRHWFCHYDVIDFVFVAQWGSHYYSLNNSFARSNTIQPVFK